MSIDAEFFTIFQETLADQTIEPGLKSQLIKFPTMESFFDFMPPVNPRHIYQARQFFIKTFIEKCYDHLMLTYKELVNQPFSPVFDPKAANFRMLKNTCLAYLLQSNRQESLDLCLKQLHSATNMTDKLGALEPLVIYSDPKSTNHRQAELAKFTEECEAEPLIVKYISSLHALADHEDAILQIKEFMQGSLFKINNPAHVIKLLTLFCTANLQRFHDCTGKGYEFIADCIIEIDSFNPSSAKKLAESFSNWQILETDYQSKMLEQLYRLNDLPTLSPRVREIVEKCLPNKTPEKLTAKNSANFFPQNLSTVANKKKEDKRVNSSVNAYKLN